MRWPNGGQPAATGSGDAGLDSPDHSADAAEIRALLKHLSQTRLAVSADLSAAAGALEDDRADIAADMFAGVERELARLRAAARPAASSPVSPAPLTDTAEPGRLGFSRHRLARAVVGAAALAVAIAVVPQFASSSHSSTGAAASAPASPSMSLVSSQFTALTQRLTAADASPAAILAAGRSWQSAVARDLPAAATSVSSASTVVTMLRVERTLVQASPTLRAPQNRSVAAALASGPNSLLIQLRSLASPQVLQTLPAVIQALPLATTTTPGTTTAAAGPVTGATPAAGTKPAQPTLPTAPAAGATTPPAPAVSPTTAPAGGVTLPPLPSTLGQLTGDQGGLGQTVGNVLNGLGLGR